MLFTKLKIKNLVRHKFVHHQKARHLRAPYTTDEFAEYFEIEILVFLIENYFDYPESGNFDQNLNFRALSSKFGIFFRNPQNHNRKLPFSIKSKF